MSNQPSFSNFGPPPVSGMARMMPWMKTLAAGGAVVTGGFMVLQLVLPDGYRPSDIAGRAAGSAERHEMLEKQDTKVEFERRVADATAQANAKAQADLAAIQSAVNERTAGLAPLSVLAGFLDMACVSGKVVSNMTATDGKIKGDWRRQDPDDGWHSGAVAVSQSTCGIGDGLRSMVLTSQLEAVRSAAAERGAPTSNGAVQTAGASAIPQRALDAIDAVRSPSRHHDYDGEVVKVQQWTDQFPDNVQKHLRANLPNDSTGWDLFVERAYALNAVLHPS